MLWTYRITATSQPRVLMRLLQLFDQQSLPIESLDVALLSQHVQIRILVHAEAEQAHRIQAKLYNQLDVRTVELES